MKKVILMALTLILLIEVSQAIEMDRSFGTGSPGKCGKCELTRNSHALSSEGGQNVASVSLSKAREHCQTDKAWAFEREDGATDCPDSPTECEKCGLTINLICRFNGKGIEVDGIVLEKALTQLGCTVQRFRGWENEDFLAADINIFCERISPQFLSMAAQNWFIPNPEVYKQELDLLDSIDLILCRTRQAEGIFNELGKRTYYLGFTTPDCFQPDVFKDVYSFIHVAGASPFKGTKRLASAWKHNPQFPVLTIVSREIQNKEELPNLEWIRERLPEEDLRFRQNACGVHMCPSQTEGYGHYIMEAMASGAVVITTDAPPMNEFIQDSRFLVPFERSRNMRLGMRYFVSSKAIADKVEELLGLTEEELRKAGEKNREAYLERKRDFQENLKILLEEAIFVTQ